MTVRPERTFERFSRGPELVKAILAMWDRNRKADWRLINGRWEAPSVLINQRIQTIVTDYDLTLSEWHYWCDIANDRGE